MEALRWWRSTVRVPALRHVATVLIAAALLGVAAVRIATPDRVLGLRVRVRLVWRAAIIRAGGFGRAGGQGCRVSKGSTAAARCRHRPARAAGGGRRAVVHSWPRGGIEPEAAAAAAAAAPIQLSPSGRASGAGCSATCPAGAPRRGRDPHIIGNRIHTLKAVGCRSRARRRGARVRGGRGERGRYSAVATCREPMWRVQATRIRGCRPPRPGRGRAGAAGRRPP